MSKFKKKSDSGTPAISTAALPDIVFMLLFFFMVTTVMRETTLFVDVTIPKATEIKKMEKKSLVSYIYIGPPVKRMQTTYGSKPRIQLNDAFAEVEQIVLGQPLVFSEDNLEYDFSAVYAMNVSNPQVFGGAFTKLVNSYNSESGSFELHEAVIGQESDVTHYWVVRSNNLATFLNARAEFFNSDELAEFISSAQGSFEPVFSFGARIIKQYN